MSDLATELAAHPPRTRPARVCASGRSSRWPASSFAEARLRSGPRWTSSLTAPSACRSPSSMTWWAARRSSSDGASTAAAHRPLRERVAQARCGHRGARAAAFAAGAMAFFSWTAEHRRSWGIMFAGRRRRVRARDAAKIRASSDRSGHRDAHRRRIQPRASRSTSNRSRPVPT